MKLKNNNNLPIKNEIKTYYVSTIYIKSYYMFID